MPVPTIILHPTYASIPLSEAGWILQKGYGEKRHTEIILLPEEAVHLISRGKALGRSPTGRMLSMKRILKTYTRLDRFTARLTAYTYLREQGFIPKSGAKYGLDYRIYPPGTKPGRTHSHWLARIVDEQDSLSMRTLAGWIRLAHSVRKTLWLIMHTEGDIVVYSMDWEETYSMRKRE